MHTLKEGYALLTIVFITTALFFIGISVVRSCTLYKDIIHQQYHYWSDYYKYEGCLEYVFAYFRNNPTQHFEVIPFYQQDNSYMIHVNKNIFHDAIYLKGEIVLKGSKQATWNLLLKKNEDTWVMQKRNLVLKFLR